MQSDFKICRVKVCSYSPRLCSRIFKFYCVVEDTRINLKLMTSLSKGNRIKGNRWIRTGTYLLAFPLDACSLKSGPPPAIRRISSLHNSKIGNLTHGRTSLRYAAFARLQDLQISPALFVPAYSLNSGHGIPVRSLSARGLNHFHPQTRPTHGIRVPQRRSGTAQPVRTIDNHHQEPLCRSRQSK